MTFHLTSPAFESGEDIPKEFTCDGPDSSPSLIWTDPPPGTETLALIVDDPDAPSGTWVHWILYNLPATTRGLSEGMGHSKDATISENSAITALVRLGALPIAIFSSFMLWTAK